MAHAAVMPRLGGSPSRLESVAAERVAQAALGARGSGAGAGTGGERWAGSGCGSSGSPDPAAARQESTESSRDGSAEGHGALHASPLGGGERPVSSGSTAGYGWRTSVRVTLH